MQPIRALGMMSGTSLDGVDLAVVTTDGETILARGPQLFRPYSEPDRDVLRAALADARDIVDRNDRPGRLVEAERIVTEAHAAAAEALIAANPGLTIDLVGFHGQTVLHAPERHLTVQLGDGRALAGRLGLPVVHEFRAADVAAGGEGAPFVPVYHRALAAEAGLTPPVAFVNIGGVANITLIRSDDDLIACDTGPGNALLDDFVLARTGAPYDDRGILAASGRVDIGALAELMANPWFDRPAPKSLDRNHFDASPVASLSTEDGAATLTAFTTATIVDAVRHHGGADRLVVSGGGAANPTMLGFLAERAGVPVDTAATFGWQPEFIEAEAFAFLAARSRAGLPLTYPGTTGVPAPTTGGVLAAA